MRHIAVLTAEHESQVPIQHIFPALEHNFPAGWRNNYCIRGAPPPTCKNRIQWRSIRIRPLTTKGICFGIYLFVSSFSLPLRSIPLLLTSRDREYDGQNRREVSKKTTTRHRTPEFRTRVFARWLFFSENLNESPKNGGIYKKWMPNSTVQPACRPADDFALPFDQHAHRNGTKQHVSLTSSE